MEKLFVDLKENSYDIKFSEDFSGLPSSMEEIKAPKKILIVTDTNVNGLYAGEVYEILKYSGYDVSVYAFKAGEESKNMNTVLDICRACIENGLDRKSMIAALGGGVTGDMAGFAAAIFMRGIRFIQIPTTLLSQSDSSVGGKTGVDFADSKNILGAFHQPKLVYINVSTLSTLPHEQFVSGMGEVIKHGIIRDAGFFGYLAENAEKIKAYDPQTLIYMAKVNCSIKADVVMRDEKENGLRAILNFGHTIGHAIESAFDFRVTHGECVGIGIVAASHIAYERSMISKDEFDIIEKAFDRYGFKIHRSLPPTEEILRYMQNDKKKAAGRIRFVLPDRIGGVIITDDVTQGEINKSLEYMGGSRC